MATVARHRTLADLLPGDIVRDALLIALGAVATGISAQLSFHIPGTPVPVTGQTFAVLLTGAALGLPRAGSAMVLYVALGVVGLPWFAAAGHGFAGVSFGYLLGFVLAAAAVGALAERGGDRTVPRTVATMLVGTVLIYLLGASWLAAALHLDAPHAFALGVRPFLIGDALKIALAAAVLPGTWWLVGRRES